MPLDEAYFVWLYSQVGSVKIRNRSKTYWALLRILYRKEFTWAEIERDGNRARDGMDLRYDFVRETNAEIDEDGWMDMPCSFLEMLIALCRKLAFEGGGEASDWFWDLMKNLGLVTCTDAEGCDGQLIEAILDNVIDRDYGVDGTGGLFPIKDNDEDQRTVEIWYQANKYLLERL